MFCPNCGKEFNSQCCPDCGYPAQSQQQQQQPFVQQVIVQQPKKKKHGCLIGIVIFIVLVVIISIAAGGSDDNDGDKSSEKSVSVSTADKKTTTAKTAEEATEETTADEESTDKEDDNTLVEKSENTYEDNEYYDIVETATIYDSIGDTIIVHKVLAKEDVSVEATQIAYASDGSVIGKSSDDITLTEGEYNYFRYYFESDISEADIQAQLSAKKSSFADGDRNAVEMVQYDLSEDDLYVSFKQVSDNLGAFSKFKLLFYKDGQIIDTEDGYFSVYAENLNGKDTTDVAEIWVYDIDFDDVEYIFEP